MDGKLTFRTKRTRDGTRSILQPMVDGRDIPDVTRCEIRQENFRTTALIEVILQDGVDVDLGLSDAGD